MKMNVDEVVASLRRDLEKGRPNTEEKHYICQGVENGDEVCVRSDLALTGGKLMVIAFGKVFSIYVPAKTKDGDVILTLFAGNTLNLVVKIVDKYCWEY